MPASRRWCSRSTSPTYNNREFDIRNGANFPPRVTLQSAIDALGHPRWLFGTLARYLLAEGRLPRFPNIHFPPEAATKRTTPPARSPAS